MVQCRHAFGIDLIVWLADSDVRSVDGDRLCALLCHGAKIGPTDGARRE